MSNHPVSTEIVIYSRRAEKEVTLDAVSEIVSMLIPWDCPHRGATDEHPAKVWWDL